MKTTLDVIAAIQDKEEVTDLELRCAVVALNLYINSFSFDLARFCTETDQQIELTPKTIRGLKRAWTNREFLLRDLEKFVLNSSYSPLLDRKERQEKASSHIAKTATDLFDLLSGKN